MARLKTGSIRRKTSEQDQTECPSKNFKAVVYIDAYSVLVIKNTKKRGLTI